ncbi:NAD-glutamate dehydrogenase domain-containing protein, partial [Bradyrhizobium sp. NBAIM08]|uniref:NAD-glutamate dehydrogenase domain-containing protein n=1 Tax=Bradyrhizobium sp. NBAIM08 TaxID=2793815 RepID=UPI001CD2FCA7
SSAAGTDPGIEPDPPSGQAPEGMDSAAFVAFRRRYFDHVAAEELAGIDPGSLSGLVASHLELGWVRTPGQHLVRVLTPTRELDGWDAGGSTVVQLVTDDRPFLVDSLSMVLARQGWSLRRLFHPQLAVRRDAEGAFLGLGTAAG